MEDQFGGRTDDDLFFDEDFEPVEAESQPVPEPSPPPASAPVEPQQPQQPPTQPSAPASKPSTPSSSAPVKGLAQSRHAGGNKPSPRPKQNNNNSSNNNNNSRPTPNNPPPSAPAAPSAPNSNNNNNITNAPPKEKPVPSTAPTAPSSDSRIQSGANPRTKLTEEELAARMERMRLVNAEKMQKFEQSQQDQRHHEQIYQKSVEEAKRRRQADMERRRKEEESRTKVDAEKRKRDAEERKKMDDERERNRARKLQAMHTKEGGWDEGKEEMAADEGRRNFRSMNGGVRGSRAGGLAGSRFARENDAEDERPVEGFGRGRGRGRGRGGRGRGGFDRNGLDGERPNPKAAPSTEKTPALTVDEFPALPPGKKPETSTSAASVPNKEGPLSPLSPMGNWGDEMEAFDEKMSNAKVPSS